MPTVEISNQQVSKKSEENLNSEAIVTINFTNTKSDFWLFYRFFWLRTLPNKFVISLGLTYLTLVLANLNSFPNLRVFIWTLQYFSFVYLLLELVLFTIHFFSIKKDKQKYLPKTIIFRQNEIFLDTTYDEKSYKWAALTKVVSIQNYYFFNFNDLSQQLVRIVVPKKNLTNEQESILNDLFKAKGKLF